MYSNLENSSAYTVSITPLGSLKIQVSWFSKFIFSVVVRKSSDDLAQVKVLSLHLDFFSILNIYTLNIKNAVTSYISNWYTQE